MLAVLVAPGAVFLFCINRYRPGILHAQYTVDVLVG